MIKERQDKTENFKVSQFNSLRIRTAVQLHNEKFPRREWLLQPWLRQRMLVLVHAPTGVGKSWFCWSLAMGIATGKGFADWACPHPQKVLIIDGEMQPDDLKDRIKFLRKNSELTQAQDKLFAKNLIIIARQDQELDTIFPDLSDTDDQDTLLDEIRDINPDLVILDNLSTLADLQDENAASSYNDIFKFLTKLKQERSAILVHHDRKGANKDSEEGYRGSSKMAAIMEQRIHISAVEDDKKPKGTGACFYAEFKKNRYIGDDSLKRRVFALHPQHGWQIEKDEDEVLISIASAVRSGNFATQAELAKYFGHTKSWANKSLSKCILEEYLTKGDWLKYSNIAKKKRELDDMTPDQLNKLTM